MTKYTANNKYDITERKKAELDQLTIEVFNAQNKVEKLQANVQSLTEKSTKFQDYLASAEATRTQAENNKKMVDEVISNAYNLMIDSHKVKHQSVEADDKVQKVAKTIQDVVDQLIFSAEVINKLENLIVRKKASNPLISDELVNMASTAGKDANNAVALSLVALNSSFTAQASNIESQGASALEYTQSKQLFSSLTGINSNKLHEGTSLTELLENKENIKDHGTSLMALIYRDLNKAIANYDKLYNANNDTINELNSATDSLNQASVKLKSLQAALAAANAAALPS